MGGEEVKPARASFFFFFFFFSFFFFLFPELRTESRALCLLGKRSTTELNPQPPARAS